MRKLAFTQASCCPEWDKSQDSIAATVNSTLRSLKLLVQLTSKLLTKVGKAPHDLGSAQLFDAFSTLSLHPYQPHWFFRLFPTWMLCIACSLFLENTFSVCLLRPGWWVGQGSVLQWQRVHYNKLGQRQLEKWQYRERHDSLEWLPDTWPEWLAGRGTVPQNTICTSR